VTASVFFVISDSILGYSKFLEKYDRTLAVMSTYYTALLFFMLSTLQPIHSVKPIAALLNKSIDKTE